MIVLYTTHCPQCQILEKKLQAKEVNYSVCEDIDTMLARGFRSAPNLEVDGKIFNFAEAIAWVNSLEV